MKPVVPFVRDPELGSHESLLAALSDAMPDLDVRPLADVDDDRRSDVEAVVVDGPSADQLASLPNLRFVQSTWAGVEALLPILPDDVELARMVDPQLSATMSEAVLAWTLYLHRDMPRYARQQRAGEWIEHDVVRASDRRIGIVGLGTLGRAAAETLRDHGFDAAGWSRSPKTIDGVESFHDDNGGLTGLLSRSDIVVNLLPHTDDTVGLLGADAFSSMPDGSSLINFGRGPTVDDDALLAALESGRIDHAVLDVFVTEPLPDSHPYWDHPRVTVLPHISGPTSADTAAVIAGRNVERFLADGTLPADALVDRSLGY